MASDSLGKVLVRDIELEDIAPIYALGERLFSAQKSSNLFRTWDEYEVLNLYMGDQESCLVAELDGALVGFALGALIEKRRNPWVYGYLLWLGVSPDHASRGIGAKLVTRIKERFIELGARIMLVDTAADNEGAVRFFKRIGFSSEEKHIYMSMNMTRDPEFERLRHKRERSERSDRSGSKLDKSERVEKPDKADKVKLITKPLEE
jgi:ribosomal protein S18 acetylase RimI-like enzyme